MIFCLSCVGLGQDTPDDPSTQTEIVGQVLWLQGGALQFVLGIGRAFGQGPPVHIFFIP